MTLLTVTAPQFRQTGRLSYLLHVNWERPSAFLTCGASNPTNRPLLPFDGHHSGKTVRFSHLTDVIPDKHSAFMI